MSKATKAKSSRVQVKELPKQEKELSSRDKKKVKGGLLPYIEQDNIYRSTSIKDGTSNTILG